MTKTILPFKRILIANRGEIAIRIMRAATELGLRTVAIFTYEDRYALHRYKADEAYRIGKEDDPLKPYLDIEEIIHLAKRKNIDAIHPGYGFLSENVQFARRCEEEGITFVGPRSDVMAKLGDKVAAKKLARHCKVPLIEDNVEPLQNLKIATQEANRIGYPVMLKAAAGGGGRGMRVVRNDDELKKSFPEARNEAATAFGDDTIFMEKYIDNPKHIEVQILGDKHGKIVHLFERDCSVQRRFQKVVEVAPCRSIQQKTKDKLYEYALRLAREVDYNNAGTVEFLVDSSENIYFIEVNPRIQVEHTVTEEITGIDLVRSQILIAQGYGLEDKFIYIQDQSDVKQNGFAIQCRVTTEDPENNFQPDYGTIIAYRNAGGFGIRLDEGSSYPGVKVSPFFDSMLVKVTASGRTLKGACERLYRTLREFRIRGVKTNIVFLENVINHSVFQKGNATVNFIQQHPELFSFALRQDRGTKVLRYLAHTTVNGNPDVKYVDPDKQFLTPVVPDYDKFAPYPKGTKDLLRDEGRDALIQWMKDQKKVLFTDTTFRDAHQSLLATRVRTVDMMQVAESFAKNHADVFSMEVWGGATFDVAMRFLKEDPWQRLQLLREAMPNLLLQMLIRSSNAVGYKAYPDNLVAKFIEHAWEEGVDVFRIFDSLNWMPNLSYSIKTVAEQTGGIAEGCICYTGDILDKQRTKYTLQYYIDLAKKIEDAGAHILGIKDMAGLLHPYAAEVLIGELRNNIKLPIHLHTHDTSSIQSATYMKAIEAGVDAVDVALSSVSGLTSQPNFNSLAAILSHHERDPKMDVRSLDEYSNYWEAVRAYYYPFESELKAGTAQVYDHEIPGGQYSNLRPQARGLGLEEQFETIKYNYAVANRLFGDVVKVTPSSKVVGDMAMFMTANGLTEEDVMNRGHQLAFPDSVISFFKGELGQQEGGFPRELQKMVLKGEEPFTDRPNAHLDPVDFDGEFESFKETYGKHATFLDFLSFKLYPKVFEDYWQHKETYGDVHPIPSPAFFFGLKLSEEVIVEIDEGKIIIVKLVFMSDPDEEGMRKVSFELNGQARTFLVRDHNIQSTKETHRKALNDNEVGAPLQGRIARILVEKGDDVEINTPLFVIEAMKMESTITATDSGKVSEIILAEGTMVEQDDLVIVLG